MTDKRKRIEIIDAVRGVAVSLMVIHHFLFDLVMLLGAPEWLFSNPVLDALQYIFASLFILISGISSNFSRSNVKRGIKVFAVALGITLVTTALGMPIEFGILHLLGFCMIFYGFTKKFWNSLPRKFALLTFVLLFVASAAAIRLIHTECPYVWMFGFMNSDFISYDYYPILPWLFMFLIGTVFGSYIAEGRMPDRFYSAKVPVFPVVGRKALIIYIVHQPVLIGITYLIKCVFL